MAYSHFENERDNESNDLIGWSVKIKLSVLQSSRIWPRLGRIGIESISKNKCNGYSRTSAVPNIVASDSTESN